MSSVFDHGRLTQQETRNPALGTLTSTTFGDDAHGRRTSSTDAPNGTGYLGYDSLDRPSASTTPAPGPGQPRADHHAHP